MLSPTEISPSSILTAATEGFEKYLTEFIGKEIVVTIVNVDTNIEGKLLEIYQDGIIMETTLLKQKVFILKNSIAFIKKKFELKVK